MDELDPWGEVDPIAAAAHVRLMRFAADYEGHLTATAEEQHKVETDVARYLSGLAADGASLSSSSSSSSPSSPSSPSSDGPLPVLLRQRHVPYLLQGLRGLPPSWTSLDASRVWVAYWILQSLDLLDALGLPDVAAVLGPIVGWLRRCQSPLGGFGGGPQQAPHAASSYAAISALLIIGTPEAYAAVNREALHAFFAGLKDHAGATGGGSSSSSSSSSGGGGGASGRRAGGGFRIQVGEGEVDVRAAYTVTAMASTLNVLSPGLRDGLVEFVLSCQSQEGGFGGEPGNEAHGGHTYCALASLALLGETHRADLPALARWLAARQMALEGGFQGRINKLVDGCYSFWQGAAVAILEGVTQGGGGGDAALRIPRLMDADALQRYVLLACQEPAGGLRDKPGKGRDFYHTCYCLSGLSVAQHGGRAGAGAGAGAGGGPPRVVGDPSENRVAEIDPLLNIRVEKARAARVFFAKLPAVV
jgi:protein farnesyltransferase subunit beta